MTAAALTCWLLATADGLLLITVWVSHRGLQGATRLPVPVLLAHVLPVTAGLGVWIAFVRLHRPALAWTAFGLLLPAVLVGGVLLLRWLPVRREHVLPMGGFPVPQDVPAERWFPPPLVLGHGLLALATVVLVFWSALRA